MVQEPRQITTTVTEPKQITDTIMQPRQVTSTVMVPREISKTVILEGGEVELVHLCVWVDRHTLTIFCFPDHQSKDEIQVVMEPQQITTTVMEPRQVTRTVMEPRQVTNTVMEPIQVTNTVMEEKVLMPLILTRNALCNLRTSKAIVTYCSLCRNFLYSPSAVSQMFPASQLRIYFFSLCLCSGTGPPFMQRLTLPQGQWTCQQLSY